MRLYNIVNKNIDANDNDMYNFISHDRKNIVFDSDFIKTELITKDDNSEIVNLFENRKGNDKAILENMLKSRDDRLYKNIHDKKYFEKKVNSIEDLIISSETLSREDYNKIIELYNNEIADRERDRDLEKRQLPKGSTFKVVNYIIQNNNPSELSLKEKFLASVKLNEEIKKENNKVLDLIRKAHATQKKI